MSRSVASMLVLFFLVSSCLFAVKPAFSASDVSEDSWTQKAPMQQARSHLGVATVNGKIYALGGKVLSYRDRFGNERTEVATNEEYDPATDTWTFKAPMPAPSSLFVTAVCQDMIFCINGGMNMVYDPANDTWQTKTPLSIDKFCWGANVVDGKIYVFGGLSNETFTEVYDPATDSWTAKTPIPTESGGCCGVFNDKIYVVGCKFEQSFDDELGQWVLVNYAFTQVYDPAADSWSTGASPPFPFYTPSMAVTTGVMAPRRMYVFNNPASAPNASSHVNLVYDPETDSWASGDAFPNSRECFATAVADDLIYVIGGYVNTYPDVASLGTGGVTTFFATVEQYTPFGYGTPDPSPSATAMSGAVSEPFPVVPVAAASVASVAVVVAALLVYFKKCKH